MNEYEALGFTSAEEYAKAKQAEADRAEPFLEGFSHPTPLYLQMVGRSLRSPRQDAVTIVDLAAPEERIAKVAEFGLPYGTVTGRFASSNPNIEYNLPSRKSGKHLAMLVAASAAGIAAQTLGAITNNRAPGDPDVIHWDELADYSDLEARMSDAMHYIDYYGGVPEPFNYPVGIGKTGRIPEPTDESHWIKYPGEPTPAGGSKHYYANVGGKAKAFEKRRAKNKAARKARRRK